MSNEFIDEMVKAYAQCALWTSMDGSLSYLDAVYTVRDISEATMKEFRGDCESFAASNDLTGWTPEQAGHDFWLTRNGHGAGFWDRGKGEQGRSLADAARAYRAVYPYAGDDGRIHA